MDARYLFAGDRFINMDPDDYANLNHDQRSKIKTLTVSSPPEECTADRSRVHFRCNAGSWCIPNEAPVTLAS